MKTTEFTHRLKADLGQTEHLDIYKMPCPECAGRIVSTARMMDDTRAPTNCENGHTFMRDKAFTSFNANLIEAQPICIEAAERLMTKFPGSVRILQCSRDGDVRWQKKVWVPEEEVDAFHAQYLMKTKGPFLYDSVGTIEYKKKKPAGVPMWNNL